MGCNKSQVGVTNLNGYDKAIKNRLVIPISNLMLKKIIAGLL
jgi:hypothetical protein